MITEERFSLKDHLFNRAKVEYLGRLFHETDPDFDQDEFVIQVMDSLEQLELKQRVTHIAAVLARFLPTKFGAAADKIEAALPPPLDPTLSDDDFGDFIIAPLGEYVSVHGTGDYERSMSLLKEITKRFSMEGPARTFIDLDPERTLDLYGQWARDENYHVRRLVSESTRPLLPWAPRISLDVVQPIPLLDALHRDTTRYVTRSVANHINDITKIDADLAMDTLEAWSHQSLQEEKEMTWIVNHSLRGLLKKGDPRALSLLGYDPDPKVSVTIRRVTPTVMSGDALGFSVELTASRGERLMVDYAIDFVKANGERRPRVFKLRRVELGAGDRVTLTKKHPLRANATTYRLYPGAHSLSIIVNGKTFDTREFEVELTE